MNDHKNMILAIVLSAIVLLGWGFITETYFPAANPPTTKIEDGRQVPLPQPKADPAADSPQAMRDRNVVLAETPRLRIETPRLSGTVNLRGARIDDLLLTTHREGLDRDSPPVRLFSPAGSPGAYFGSFGWSGENQCYRIGMSEQGTLDWCHAQFMAEPYPGQFNHIANILNPNAHRMGVGIATIGGKTVITWNFTD